MIRQSITVAGDSTQSRASGSTGQIASSPLRGSRTTPLANDDAAAFGRPGRTVIVGSRITRPSMKPRRVQSPISNSAIAFCVPYDVCGLSAVLSSTFAGMSPP